MTQATATEKKTLVEFSAVGKYHKGPAAPNGSVLGQQERRIVRCRVYVADFYGTGGLTDDQIAVVIQAIGEICNHCWDDGAGCQCWNDE
jgi:hypothetical protein